MVSVVLLFTNNHDVISYNNYLIDLSKVLVKLPLEHISSYSYAKWHYSVPISANLHIEGGEIRGASSSFWCQYPFLQLQTVIMQVSANRYAISSGILK